MAASARVDAKECLLAMISPFETDGPCPLPASESEWRRLARLARIHRVDCQVAERVAGESDCPADVAEYFDRMLDHAKAVRKTMVLVQAEIGEAFDRVGIPFIVLKGTGLAERFYENPVVYCSRDTDLLLRPADLDGVAEVMLARGYQRQKAEYYREHHFHDVWHHRHRQAGGCVEIHRDVSLPSHPVRFPIDEWWQRAPRVELASGPVLLPPPVDEVAYLAWHGLIHGSVGLRELAVWARAFKALAAAGRIDEVRHFGDRCGGGGFLARAALLSRDFWGLETCGCESGSALTGSWPRLADAAFDPDHVFDQSPGMWWPLRSFGYWSMLPPAAGGIMECCRHGIAGRLDYDEVENPVARAWKYLRYGAEFWLAAGLYGTGLR